MQIYLYTINLYIFVQRGWEGVVELLLCFRGGLTPLMFGKLCTRVFHKSSVYHSSLYIRHGFKRETSDVQ